MNLAEQIKTVVGVVQLIEKQLAKRGAHHGVAIPEPY